MVRKILVLVVVFILGVSAVLESYAQDAAVQSNPAVENSSAVSVDQVEVGEEGKVSFDFREVDIHNVLRTLALKSGVNIVTSPSISGSVTIQLNDVPWQQALDVILNTYGFASEKKDNVVLVMTIEEMKKRRENEAVLAEQEPLLTKTFTLNFAKAAKVITSIDKMKSPRGNVNFDERTNTLIVTDIDRHINLISGVVKKLDTTTPQVLIESKIVETNFTDTENLGVDWLVEATANGSERPNIWPFTTSSESKYLPDSIPSTEEGFTYGTLDFSQVQAVFEALRTKNDTNIISNPRVVTLDNQAAEIIVGEQYPIPTYTYNEDQARLQVSGWEYKDIGMIFNVTPTVNSAGYVSLTVFPKITDITGFVTVENTTLPRLSNESAKTNVMVKDGDTLVIGGLIKKKVIDVKKKTPFLGDIPIMGYVFQKKEKTDTKTDLLIFITPHIMTVDIPEAES
jgi:type IV pilus assembly protein PilQ